MNSRQHNHVCMMAEGSHGGFAAKLAEAWLAADKSNQATLNKAFSRLFTPPAPGFHEYKDFVRKLARMKMPVFDDCEKVLLDLIAEASELSDAETLL